jgi:hypothetical protein
MVNALVVAGSEKAEAVATRIRARICMFVKQVLTAYCTLLLGTGTSISFVLVLFQY